MGRAEGTIKQLIEAKVDLKTLLLATIAMVVSRGTCDLEDILSLQKFAIEQCKDEANPIDEVNKKIGTIDIQIKEMNVNIDNLSKLIPSKETIVPDENIKEEGTAEGEVGPKIASEKIEETK